MISENIRFYRKQKGFSQEEMAVRLHVVRQTVSKWEKGLSVPDADVLIQISELLEVPVSQLLGTEPQPPQDTSLAEELARVNELLAQKQKQEKRLILANKKRGLMISLSLLAMLMAFTVNIEWVSALLAGLCMLAAVLILYRNLALLTSVTTDDLRLGVLRLTTLINIGILVLVMIFALLTGLDVITLTEGGEQAFAMALICLVMLFVGLISPKLPFNRHTGLRLPWTVQDEDTWNLAHRILGYISLPLVLLYIGCTFTISDFETVTLAAVLIWIGVPGVISGVYYHQKMQGKR